MTNDDFKEAREIVGSYIQVLSAEMDDEGEGDAADTLRAAWRLIACTENKESERPEGVLEYLCTHPRMVTVGDTDYLVDRLIWPEEKAEPGDYRYRFDSIIKPKEQEK